MLEVRLRPHASLGDLEKTLRTQANESDNVVSLFVQLHPKDGLDKYLGWVNEAWRMLGNHLPRPQLERLLHTRHYWALRQMDGNEAWLIGQIKNELNARRDALVELADAARILGQRWNIAAGVIVVPDTNLLLHATNFFDDLDWQAALAIDASIHLAIPMVVVDQIDSLKRSKQPIRSRARQTANRIEALLGSQPLERVVLRDEGPFTTTIEVLTDPLDHERLADSDSEIVDRAAYLRNLTTTPVHIATWDNLMRFRAAAAGLEVVKPHPEYELHDEPPEGARGPRT